VRTLVKNGTVVTAADTFAADVLIEDGKIAAIGRSLGDADETIDSAGKYVFPGGIDEHLHFSMPFGGTMSQPWQTESVAAAVGGTTTVLDFAMQPVGGMLADGIREWRENKARGNAAVDYGFHIAVCDLRPDVIEEIPEIVEQGVPTLKCLMAYKGTPLMVDDETLFRTLQKARTCGALVLVHQENGHVIDVLQKELLAEGKVEPKYHAVSRPPASEATPTSSSSTRMLAGPSRRRTRNRRWATPSSKGSRCRAR
jgi:dihydropyrimidinase